MDSQKVIYVIAGAVLITMVLFLGKGIYSQYKDTSNSEPWLVEITKTANKQSKVPDSKIPRSADSRFGLEFSYSMWLYLDGWEDNSRYKVPNNSNSIGGCKRTQYGCCPNGVTSKTDPDGTDCKSCNETQYGCCDDNVTAKIDEHGVNCGHSLTHILNKGDANALIQGPGIWLRRNKLKNDIELVVKMNTFFTYPQCTGEACYLEKCSIGNIPVNKWVHVTVSVINKYVDIYVNGFLKKRCVLNGLPKQNDGNVYLNSFGGFNGYMSKVRYFNYSLPIWKIEQIVSQGPSQYVEPGVSNTIPPYLSYNWWQKGFTANF
jgi:hypothetical protein